MKRNFEKGITLVALVITIIVLIILAGISINLVLGENGIIKKAKEATIEYDKQEAIEKINFKIASIQISNYEKNEKTTLQDLADALCEDEEVEYVTLETKKVASIEKIIVGNATSIFTKFKKNEYEFEIGDNLQIIMKVCWEK